MKSGSKVYIFWLKKIEALFFIPDIIPSISSLFTPLRGKAPLVTEEHTRISAHIPLFLERTWKNPFFHVRLPKK